MEGTRARGAQGRVEGPPGSTLRVVTGATEKSVMGGTAGDRLWGDILRGSSPGGLGGLPAVPGLRRVPGMPGFPALGASGRVAAAPPSPSERSVAAGPNHRSHWGEAALCHSRRPLGSPSPLGEAAAQPWCRAAGQFFVAFSRTSASKTGGSASQPQKRTPSPLPSGTVW